MNFQKILVATAVAAMLLLGACSVGKEAAVPSPAKEPHIAALPVGAKPQFVEAYAPLASAFEAGADALPPRAEVCTTKAPATAAATAPKSNAAAAKPPVQKGFGDGTTEGKAQKPKAKAAPKPDRDLPTAVGS